MVHKKRCLDGDISEITVPTKMWSLMELGMELVFFTGLSMVEDGHNCKTDLFKVLHKLY